MPSLLHSENLLYNILETPWEAQHVDLGNGQTIHTFRSTNSEMSPNQIPTVLVHGYGSGKGLWAPVLDALAAFHQIYTLDLLGHGLSSRPVFPLDSLKAEDMYLQALEDWRGALKLEKLNLAGHSFGGYLIFKYAMKYPKRVEKLILLDPWGFGGLKSLPKVPLWARPFLSLHRRDPHIVMRLMGPLGRRAIGVLRRDLKLKLTPFYGDTSTVTDYIFRVNQEKSSGDQAFLVIADPKLQTIAQRPIMDDLMALPADFPPITLIAGSESWMNRFSSFNAISELPVNAEIHWLEKAGHHLFLDTPREFAEVFLGVLAKKDGVDQPSNEPLTHQNSPTQQIKRSQEI